MLFIILRIFNILIYSELNRHLTLKMYSDNRDCLISLNEPQTLRLYSCVRSNMHSQQ
jgi:hypothetical protein